jgi:chromosome segregation ATPase
MNKNKLISEDLKRYRQLLEYTFYVPEDKEKDLNGDLLLDDSFLTEQDPAGDDPFMDVADDEEGQAPEGEGQTPDVEDTEGEALSGEEDTEGEEDVEIEDEFAETEPEEDTVEVDVTDIVDNTEETKKSVDGVSDKMEELFSKLTDLEKQVSGMDKVIDKIENLGKEIEKRNPTPVERLEMRSMESFPYSVKLTDYWTDKEGYEATEKDEEEYVLRQSDIDSFDKNEIKKSFG